MKLRTLLIAIFAILLSACSFSLAEDMTPPPGYIPPTPAPTLGPLFPAQAPSLENGAAIYTEKCAACHGPEGKGDGEQGKQLPVTVAALGLPQIGRTAAPAEWFTTVTRGNMERYMPPFTSLSDQERWDVVAYALSLQTNAEQIAQGQMVFESNCAGCSLDFFKDQAGMAALNADDLVLLLKGGSDKVTALSGNLSDDDLYAAAAYLRTLTFAAPTPTPEPATPAPTVAAVEVTPSTTESGTPSAETTPAITETAVPSTPEAVGGKVNGTVSGANVNGLTITLRGYDHAADASGPQETVTLTGVTDANGNFAFEGLEMPENRIYVADALYQGVTYSSSMTTVTAGMSELTLAPFKVYETTNDYSTLVFDQVHFFFDIADGAVQVIGVYTFKNTSESTIVVQSTTDVPFIKTPPEAQNIGFELSQDSAPLMAAEGGFALLPSETPYGVVAYYTLPYDKKAEIAQPFGLSATSLLVLVPEGVKVKSDQVTKGDVQTFQGANYDEYLGTDIKSGDTLSLSLSGMPKATGTTPTSTNSQQNLLIGVGALGLVLILAGVWMYLRDRNRPEEEVEEVEEEDEFDTEEEILDAIIALDDLHRAGKLPDEAYQTRRAELKARLK
jgi:mono/diheme cytochrome c family protein